VLGIGLAACSGTTFVYNRLDFIVPWYLGRYVDLDASQSDLVDVRLAPLLEWHRRNELPRYAAFLEDLERDLNDPISLEQVKDYADRVEQAWFRLRDPGLEQLLVLGEQLSDEQLDDFIAVVDKQQRKYERKYLARDEEEYREDALESLEDSFEDYLGRLTQEQRERLSLAVAQLWRSDTVWLSERSKWTAALETALERKPGWQAGVTAIVRDWEAQLDAEVAALYDHNRDLVQAALVDVVNSRTARQDKRLRKELTHLHEDLVVLSNR
jgi:hypothetical protein